MFWLRLLTVSIVHFGRDDYEEDLFFTNFAFGTVVDPQMTLQKISIGDDDDSSDGDSDSDD